MSGGDAGRHVGEVAFGVFFGLWAALGGASPRERTRPVTIAGLAEIVRR